MNIMVVYRAPFTTTGIPTLMVKDVMTKIMFIINLPYLARPYPPRTRLNIMVNITNTTDITLVELPILVAGSPRRALVLKVENALAITLVNMVTTSMENS